MQAGPEVCFGEVEAGFSECRGSHAAAGEEEFAGHFTEDNFCHEGGEWKEGGSVEDRAESFCEVEIGGGMWAHEVHGTAERGVFGTEGECPSEVSEPDPAPVLAAVADDATGTELKGEQHFLEGAAFAGEYDTDAAANNAEPQFVGCEGCLFPVMTDIGEEAGSLRRVFGKNFFAAVTVEANCGGRNECCGAFIEFFEGVDNACGSDDAAVANASFDGVIPSGAGDVFAGEVDDGIDGVETFGIEKAAFGVPEDGVIFGGFAGDGYNSVSGFTEDSGKAGAYETGCASDGDSLWSHADSPRDSIEGEN